MYFSTLNSKSKEGNAVYLFAFLCKFYKIIIEMCKKVW